MYDYIFVQLNLDPVDVIRMPALSSWNIVSKIKSGKFTIPQNNVVLHDEFDTLIIAAA